MYLIMVQMRKIGNMVKVMYLVMVHMRKIGNMVKVTYLVMVSVSRLTLCRSLAATHVGLGGVTRL